MAVEQISLLVLLFSLAIFILPVLHIHLYLHIAVAKRTNGQGPEKFPKGSVPPEIGEHRVEKHFLFFSLESVSCRFVSVKNSHSKPETV
jgi:hypothetical protein